MNSKTLAIVLVAINLLVWITASRNNPEISAENGWLETFQAVCLLAGAAIFVAVFFLVKGRELRLMLAGLTLFYANFLLREINVKNLDFPPSLVYFLGGAGRNWALATGWAILFVLFLRRRKAMTRVILSWLKTASGLFLIAAGFFYLAGIPFDKKMFGFPVETHELFEEILEAQAALAMLFAAGFSFAEMRRQSDETVNKI